MGTCSSDTAQFFFEDVKVPAKNIIGDEGMGFTYQMLQFQEERMAAVIGGITFLQLILNFSMYNFIFIFFFLSLIISVSLN